jgi:hypothetical protein
MGSRPRAARRSRATRPSATGAGIVTLAGSTVWGNTVRVNTGFGLELGSLSGDRENVISSNGAGTVRGTGLVDLGNDACNGTAVCP